MKVHINQIPDDGLHIEGEEPAGFLEIDSQEPVIEPAGPVHYSLDVGISGGGLFATGQVGVDLHIECVTCLTRFIYPLEVSNFAMQTELGGSETVDLTPFIREDIFLALPPHPRCDWNGQNTCKGIASVGGAVASVTEETPVNAWEALDQLNLEQPEKKRE